MITKREIEFLTMLAQDHTYQEIADHLYISVETVKSHRKNIGAKFNVKTNGGLIYKAVQKGLLTMYMLAVISIPQVYGQHIVGLQVDASQNVLFGDNLNGLGSKLIWNSERAALRAGAIVHVSGVESLYWNVDSIADYSTAFGRNNRVTSLLGMSWGDNNAVIGIGGTTWGEANISKGLLSTSWGTDNISSGENSTSWGMDNISSGENSTSWGRSNLPSGDISTSWGSGNQASGRVSTVWGWGNEAQSSNETVIGRWADTLTHSNPISWENDDQLFVVGNGAYDESVLRRNNAFTVMKSGEVKIDKQLTLEGFDSEFGVGDDDGVIYAAPSKASSDLILVANDGVAIHIDEKDVNSSFFSIYNGFGSEILSLNEAGGLTITGTYSPSSDVNRKENITPIDNRSILQKLKEISIAEWQFKGERIRHISPMAQDFYAAFGLGQGETTISTVDADGVALAAIQALADENESLKKRLNKLELLVNQIIKE